MPILRLCYRAYRASHLSLPFKVLGSSLASKKEMADRGGKTSNPESPLFSAWNTANKQASELTVEDFEQLLNTLADWNDYF